MDDEVAPRIAQARYVEPHGLKRGDGSGIERALGNRDAQGLLHGAGHGVVGARVSRVLACRARALQPLEREGEARCWHVVELGKHPIKRRVVAPARTNGIGQVAGIDLEHETRVVIEGIHDRKIEGKRAVQAEWGLRARQR